VPPDSTFPLFGGFRVGARLAQWLGIALHVEAVFLEIDDVIPDRGDRGAAGTQAHHTEGLTIEELGPETL
jgi:hypothetical protein